MKLKYYLRGMGIGIIITAIVMGIALGGRENELSDAEIMARARELGMIDSTVLSDYATQGSMGDALGGNGENGNNADGQAQDAVKSVTQSGEASTRHKVVFERVEKPVEDNETLASSASTGISSASTGRSETAAAAAVSTAAITGASSLSTKSVTASTGTSASSAEAATASTGFSASPAESATVSTGASAQSVETADASTGASVPSSDTAVASAGTSVSSADIAAASTGTSAQSAETADASPGISVSSDDIAVSSAGTTATGSTKMVVIPSGVGSETVARILAEAGLVDSAAAYDKYLCDQHIDRILRSGSKSIPEGASWEEIAGIITK